MSFCIPLFSIHNFKIPAKLLSGENIVAFIHGSRTSFILVCSGHSAGLCISKASSLVFKTLYTTLGGVTT